MGLVSLAVLGWQLLIFTTLVLAGSSRKTIAVLWVIWTIVQVFTLPLSIVQFATIYFGYTVGKTHHYAIGNAVDAFIKFVAVTAAAFLAAGISYLCANGIFDQIRSVSWLWTAAVFVGTYFFWYGYWPNRR